MSFFETFGIKRYIASVLSVIVEVLRFLPGAGDYIAVVETIAGLFGITGITHASITGAISEKKLATASSAIAVLITITYFIPALEPFRGYLQQIAALFGASAIGARLKEKEVEKVTTLIGEAPTGV